MYTLFVDNLPESMDPRSMYSLFLKFGVVKDVFIPQKRRKTTNTRFGFVRFNCPVAASVAEQKGNGIWVDDKALIVHGAVHGKEKGDQMRWKQVQRRQLELRRPADKTGPTGWNQGIDGRSYVEVIKGAQPRGQHTATIKVEEVGNGWLYESMI
ncbi:serine/arginine-rich splicing factor 8-like [Camellia sinensis]|uniref:serine/arginine-rich splicing factor 8-like n=1 Tax=Camellia sinensis TaxID=4442 RepID=UPI0010365F48|nr:serine/arginine-rich splicing factor 8-like [Camellia sinensis]